MSPLSPEPLHWRYKPFPELVRLAWPIGVSMLSYSVMTLVDTLFVGRLGAAALAGVGVGGVAAFTLLCFGFGLLQAVKVLVSQAVGAGKRHRVGAIVGAGLFIAVAVGGGNIVLGRLLSGELDRVMATAASAAHGATYLDVRVLGTPLFLIAVAIRETRHGLGDTQAPMRAALAANLANVVLDYLLIFEVGLGVEGAAWASVAAHGLDAGLLLLVHVRKGAAGDADLELGAATTSRPSWRHRFGIHRGGLAQLGAVWRLGLPLGWQMLLEVGVFAVLTGMFAAMSEVDAAAHQIALQVIHLSFMPAVAIGEASSVLVGQAVGAGQDGLVRPLGRLTLALTSAYTGLCGILFAALAWPIARAFSDDPLLLQTTVHLLWVAATFQLADGANIVGRSVLRGTGDVRVPAMVNIATAWLCTPPVTLALGFGLGWGVLGGWLGFCLEIIVGAAILWWRLERGGWHQAARRSREALAGPASGPVSAPLPAGG